MFTARTDINNPMNAQVVSVGNHAVLSLVDFDDDGDFDIWVGNNNGNLVLVVHSITSSITNSHITTRTTTRRRLYVIYTFIYLPTGIITTKLIQI